MAEAVERFSYPEYEPGNGQAVPIQVLPSPPLDEFQLDEFEDDPLRHSHTRSTLDATLDSARNAFQRGQTYTVDALRRISSRSRESALRARSHAQKMVEERPLQALAVVGCAAFTLGVIARIWRSRRAQ